MDFVMFFSMERSRSRRALICSLVLAPLLGTSACNDASPPPPPPPQQVDVITTKKTTVPYVFTRVAQTESSREVQVVARVSGFLDRIAYTEGDLVEEGDVMFELDRKPFLAEVDAARGELEASKARLWTAQANLNRTRPLAEADALSQSDLDRAIGEEKAAQAAVYSATARLQKAELDLGYTTIHAPVTGLSGRAKQREGAYINAMSESANLSYVSRTDPIWVNFSVSQNDVESVREQGRKGTLVLPSGSQYEFEILLADGSTYPHIGKLDFLSPDFDQRTGTFSARATVPNPDDILRPGMFVNARVKGLQRPNAVTVPQEAVQQTSNGHVVWVVKDDGTAENRPVVMGEWVGKDWVVEQGLSGGETVIVGGLNRLRPGIAVKTTPYDASKKTPDNDRPAG
jgi:membrane fusion protein (multidrug efflux system)